MTRTRIALLALAGALALMSVGATAAQAKLVKLTGSTHGHALAAGDGLPGQQRRGR